LKRGHFSFEFRARGGDGSIMDVVLSRFTSGETLPNLYGPRKRFYFRRCWQFYWTWLRLIQ